MKRETKEALFGTFIAIGWVLFVIMFVKWIAG
jgi:hypothetical protein